MCTVSWVHQPGGYHLVCNRDEKRTRPTALTPRLLERAGPGTEQGTITGIFTVLVDGDDHNDPVADAIRGTRDLARGLSPVAVVRGSLRDALERLARDMGPRPSISIAVSSHPAQRCGGAASCYPIPPRIPKTDDA